MIKPDRPLRILVADDHPAIRKMVTRTLEQEPGFEVVAEAENGLEAVLKTEQLRPDVVVLNIVMPVLDGFGAADRIRKQLPDTAIVILSSHADCVLIEEAKRIGAQACVPKSEAVTALVKAVQAAVETEEFYVVE